MSRIRITRRAITMGALAVALAPGAALAQKNYGPGVTDTEIKIGQTMPYSGPASAYGTIGKAEAAYFKMINEQGGINGRKINFISYDDAYNPPKAVEQTRKLVESDEVLLVFQSLGTPPNAAIQKYLNTKKVPQLFASTGATRFSDYKEYPVDDGLQSELPVGRAHLRQIHPGESPQREDRRALSERRSRQGLSQGAEGRARRQGVDDDRRRSAL